MAFKMKGFSPFTQRTDPPKDNDSEKMTPEQEAMQAEKE